MSPIHFEKPNDPNDRGLLDPLVVLPLGFNGHTRQLYAPTAGAGNLVQMTKQLDALVRDSVDTVWITPFYSSPKEDDGYDIDDLTAIDPDYGTLDDFDRFVDRAHALGIKVFMDFVPNHISTNHPWYREVVENPESPKRNWFPIRERNADGTPPTNALGLFPDRSTPTKRPSAWRSLAKWEKVNPSDTNPHAVRHEVDGWIGENAKYVTAHTFGRGQADVDWENPELVKAMLDSYEFWLQHGVDGCRLDVAGLVRKDFERYRELPSTSLSVLSRSFNPYQSNIGLQEIADLFARYDKGLLIGEINFAGDDAAFTRSFYMHKHPSFAAEEIEPAASGGAGALTHSFTFELLKAPPTASAFEQVVGDLQRHQLEYGMAPAWVLQTHDYPRTVNRYFRYYMDKRVYNGDAGKDLDKILEAKGIDRAALATFGCDLKALGEFGVSAPELAELGATPKVLETAWQDATQVAQALTLITAALPGMRVTLDGEFEGVEDGRPEPGYRGPFRNGPRTVLPLTANSEADFDQPALKTGRFKIAPHPDQIAVEVQETDPDSMLSMMRAAFAARRDFSPVFSAVVPRESGLVAFQCGTESERMIQVANPMAPSDPQSKPLHLAVNEPLIVVLDSLGSNGTTGPRLFSGAVEPGQALFLRPPRSAVELQSAIQASDREVSFPEIMTARPVSSVELGF